MLDAAQERRAAGVGVDPDPTAAIDPVDMFRRGITASIAEIEALSPSDWSAPLLKREWNVREMVGHLLGAARATSTALWDATRRSDDLPLAEHVAFTQPWIDAERSSSPSDSTRAFAEAFTALAEHAQALDAEALATTTQYYGFEVQRSTALVAASFELWAHVDDIRRAVGHEPLELSGDELSLMCRLAGGILPFTMGYVGTPHPGRTARLVLTGAGGGTYVVIDRRRHAAARGGRRPRRGRRPRASAGSRVVTSTWTSSTSTSRATRRSLATCSPARGCSRADPLVTLS